MFLKNKNIIFKIRRSKVTDYAALILCHDSTGCDEMGDYFATEADTMIDIVRVT